MSSLKHTMLKSLFQAPGLAVGFLFVCFFVIFTKIGPRGLVPIKVSWAQESTQSTVKGSAVRLELSSCCAPLTQYWGNKRQALPFSLAHTPFRLCWGRAWILSSLSLFIVEDKEQIKGDLANKKNFHISLIVNSSSPLILWAPSAPNSWVLW